MKKVLAMILSLMFVFTSFSASAQSLDFLSQMYTNYTGDYEFSFIFDSPESVMALLNELEMPDMVNNFVDVKSILTGILSSDGTVRVQSDISADFKKANLSVISSGKQDVTFNSNLELGIKSKTGIWMSLDLTDEKNPQCKVIYSYPFTNKYMTVDVYEMLKDEEEKRQTTASLTSVFNKDFFTDITTFSAGLLAKYADIKVSGSQCVIKLDNSAFSSILGELMPKIAEICKSAASPFSTDAAETEALNQVFEAFGKLSGISFLGDKGITITYQLKNNKISSFKGEYDLSIDISQIYSAVSGDEWDYISRGKLDFSLSFSGKLSKIDSTKVDIPVLTEENSFSMNSLMDYGISYTEDYPEYGYHIPYYVYGESKALPIINGTIYVPLRSVLEEALSDNVSIAYDNGKITVSANEPAGFSSLELNVNSDKALLDGTEYSVGTVFVEDGTTYVSSALFTNVFGWELVDANHNIIENTYSFGFFTSITSK